MSYHETMRARYAHVLIDRMEKRIAETGELPAPLAETIERVLWGEQCDAAVDESSEEKP